MSLDLSSKVGRAHNLAALAAADLSGVTAATFDSGDFDEAGVLLLQVDTAAGDIDAATMPVSLLDSNGAEALIDGVEVTIVKNSADGNKVTFTDPVTNITYSYVNRQGESITLVFDTSSGTGQWVAKI